MAETKRMTAEEVVGYLLEGKGLDFLRESLSWVVQQLMEAEVSELIGAGRGERAPEERLTHRNGYRARPWQTRAGELELAIPKLRRGSYFPSFLEPRRRSEQALVSVVQEAYVAGVSTRKVDQVVESLGLRISKSEVSRICLGLDEQVEAFRQRPLEGRYPYLWLDAKVEKVRDGGRVVRKALVLAYGVHESGYREVIALDVGEAETEAFWRRFPRSLVERGLDRVQLVVSDAHAGLKKAIAQVLGCPWQRCSVHFLREALGHVRKDQQGMVAALLRPLFSAEGARPPASSSAMRSHGSVSPCRSWRRSSRRPRRTCSPSTPSPPSTGRSSAPPTHSSASTARSAGAPTSSGSSPTTAPSSGLPPRSSSSKTTSGSSAAATSQHTRWSRSSRKRKERKTVNEEVPALTTA
jgi:transposase-like protein